MSTPDPLIGSILGDDFRVVRQVAFGGYARVYAAEQLSVGRRAVAVKVLHAVHSEVATAVAAIKREAAYLAILHSPCFPRILRTGVAPSGAPYFVMEFVQGRTLEAVLKEAGRLPVDRAVAVMDDVCEGVCEMHQRDILHRDIKCGNIAVEETRGIAFHARLFDLGSAKPAYDQEGTSTRTVAQVGSPPYLAPETVASGTTNELTDQYALGAVAYEALCGTRAVHMKDTTPEAYFAYLKSNQPIPTFRLGTIQPDVPEAVELVVQRALSRDPAARFSSVLEFRQSLVQAAGRIGSTRRDAPPAGKTDPKPHQSFIGRARNALKRS